jgi:hypothetical protein
MDFFCFFITVLAPRLSSSKMASRWLCSVISELCWSESCRTGDQLRRSRDYILN